ncbi:DNA mismatch repair endonuclease MutL, partial [Vibrio diabolicus]
LADALAQSAVIDKPQVNESAFHRVEPNESEEVEHSLEPETVQRPTSSPVPERVYQAIESTPAYPGRSDYEVKPRDRSPRDTSVREARVADSFKRTDWVESKPASKPNHNKERHVEPAPSKQEVRAYHELLKTPEFESQPVTPIEPQKATAHASLPSINVLGKALVMVDEQFVLMSSDSGAALVSLPRAEFYRVKGQLTPSDGALKAQPLLVPLSIKLEAELVKLAQDYQQDLALL